LLFLQGSVAGKLQVTNVRRVYTGTVGAQNFVLNIQDMSGKNCGFLCFPDNERELCDCDIIIIIIIIIAAAALDGVGW